MIQARAPVNLGGQSVEARRQAIAAGDPLTVIVDAEDGGEAKIMVDAVGGVENMQEAAPSGWKAKGGGRKGGRGKSGSGRYAPSALPATAAEIAAVVTEAGVPRTVASIVKDYEDKYQLEGDERKKFVGGRQVEKLPYFAGTVNPKTWMTVGRR